MSITHTTRSFHFEVKRLVETGGYRKRDAWEKVEKEYFEKTGKNRYKNYKSFRFSYYKITKMVFVNKMLKTE